MRSRYLLIGIALLVIGGMPLVCLAQADVTLQTRMEARATTLPEGLGAFYHERSYVPVWTQSAEALQQAEVLLGVLQTSDRDGLVPGVYGVDALAAQVRALQSGSRVDAMSRADLELDLSNVLFRYVAHLSQGRIPPASLHAGWEETHDDGDLLALVRNVLASEHLAEALNQLSPPYAGYTSLRDALARYREIQAAGGWPRLYLEGTLRRDDQSAKVQDLRSRLAIAEDSLSTPPVDPDNFDEMLEVAVRAFQGRHGLEVDGIVGPQTRAALNVPVEERIRQIEYSMERWRWLPHLPDAQYILINVAGGRLQVIEDEYEVLEMKVIVGKQSTPTPLFHSEIQEVVLAPYWYVPASIIRNEIQPRLQRDPGYLARNNMHWLSGGQLRQDPGPSNPLGRLKFIFPNRFSVGLHDTSEPHLFERSTCAFSHGCIRLEKPVELALYALRDDTTWTKTRLEATINQWKETRIAVPTLVPVYVLYWTAWVDERGSVHFGPDLYDHDQALQRALSQAALSMSR